MCGPDCINRVIQKGRKHKLAIFRTDNGCGWGVKALERISAGSFVVEYVGEILTREQASEREGWYAEQLMPCSYSLFAEVFVIDPTLYGNAARFINHDEDPNADLRRAVARGLLRYYVVALRDIAVRELGCPNDVNH